MSGKAPDLSEILPRRNRPEPSRSSKRPHCLLFTGILVAPQAFPEYKRRGAQQRRRLVVQGRRGQSAVRGSGDNGGVSPDRDRRGGETRRSRAGSRRGDDRRLGLAEKPLDRLAVGFVAELSRQLEHASRADDRHPDPPPSPVDFAVSVFRRRFLHGESSSV
ncbi:Uncharacterized protein Rs2_14345 [Raphanus sativus]|nr:Uncharacterized protein Rs2_14345 [Raphanus sativus]